MSIIGEGTFYEWFKSIFTLKDEDIEDQYGEDALQYLRFQRYVIGYLMFVMVICISVILPLNFMGGLQGISEFINSLLTFLWNKIPTDFQMEKMLQSLSYKDSKVQKYQDF